MSDFCADCRYRPDRRTGDDAFPYTAGYWWFLQRNRTKLAGNHRMRQPLRSLDRLSDLAEVVEQVTARGSTAP
jgi:deoxyribodipyrimidine photolyase-related protein